MRAFSIEGSFNNYIGLPVSMAVTPRDTHGVVYEIGTNHEGEIAPLAQLAQPSVAVVLNVLPVHIGNFPSLEALTIEKFSISDGLDETGVLVCSTELAQSKFLPQGKQISTFGFDARATVQIKQVKQDRYSYSCGTELVEVNVPGGGTHRAETLGAAGAVLHALQRPLSNLDRVGEQLPIGRGNVHHVQGILVIDESYNANPTSMRAALLNLASRSVEGRRVAVLGQMNELGERAIDYHSGLARDAEGADVVFCVGDLMNSLYARLGTTVRKHFYSSVSDQLMNDLLSCVSSGDAVMIKGSHSFFWEADFVNRFVGKLNSQV